MAFMGSAPNDGPGATFSLSIPCSPQSANHRSLGASRRRCRRELNDQLEFVRVMQSLESSVDDEDESIRASLPDL